MTNLSTRQMAYWGTTVLTALLFAVPGVLLVTGSPHFVVEMKRLGFPDYFLPMFGALKMAGAAVILAPGLPRLKEWAYAGMAFDAVLAFLSRAAIGDPIFMLVPPVAIGALMMASWSLRPEGRTLATI